MSYFSKVLHVKEMIVMRVTRKGQVTIPVNIRNLLGIHPESEVEFLEDEGKVILVKSKKGKKIKRFREIRGSATVKMSTEEIMRLTRGE